MRKDNLIVWTPLAIGGILLAISYFLSPVTAGGAWWRSVSASGGAVFIGVSISEIFLKHFPRLIKEQKERAFEQFFGMAYSDVPGHIILQADRMDTALTDLSDAPAQIEAMVNEPVPPQRAKARSNRLFKARRWVNAHDAEAARAIRQAFRDLNKTPPELQVQGHNGQLNEKVQFVISTGLGFTDCTHEILEEACDGWLRYFPATECGDVVGLLEDVYPSNSRDFAKISQAIGDYRILIPPNWNKDRLPPLAGRTVRG